MSTIICERCGKEFTRTSRSKICPECREAVGMTKKVSLDKKVKSLHAAGTTYAAAQKAETLASIPKIEVPEHLLRVETPEAMMVEPGSGGNGADYISQVNEDLARAFDEGRQAAADAGWDFCRAILSLPDDLRDRLLALDYQDAVEEAKRIKSLLSLALGIR